MDVPPINLYCKGIHENELKFFLFLFFFLFLHSLKVIASLRGRPLISSAVVLPLSFVSRSGVASHDISQKERFLAGHSNTSRLL